MIILLVNEKEITELEKQYHKLKNKSPEVDRSAFKNLFGAHLGLPEILMDKVFDTFDRDRDGIVNTREFVVGLSQCCRGSEEQKLQCKRFLFIENCFENLFKSALIRLIPTKTKNYQNLNFKLCLNQFGILEFAIGQLKGLLVKKERMKKMDAWKFLRNPYHILMLTLFFKNTMRTKMDFWNIKITQIT